MEKQWGDNPEYTVSIWHDLTCWALPINIEWQCHRGVVEYKHFFLTLKFLCFGIQLEIWNWSKKYDNIKT